MSMTVRGRGACTNNFFGTNPARGIRKECQLEAVDSAPAPAPAPAPSPTAGTATLQWAKPTLNVDGTPLTDIGGYRVVYGISATSLTNSISVPDANSTSYVITGLSPGVYYFAITTLNSSGIESTASNPSEAIVQ